jgi:O-antigen/teichoic acid export membrane protein
MQGSNLIIKNTVILYAKILITFSISLYSTRLILNALGAADYGLFNLVAGLIAMLTFLNNALTGATQRYLSHSLGKGEEEKQKKIFNASVFLHLIIGILVVLIIELVGKVAFNYFLTITPDRIAAARIIFQFMVASTFLAIISVPYDAVINSHENMLLYSIISIIESIFMLSIALFVSSLASDKLIWYGILVSISSFVLLIVRRLYCRLKYTESIINFKKHLSKSVVIEMLGFAKWTLFSATSSMVGAHGITMLLNSFFGTTVNAAQGIAMQLNGQIGAFSGTMLKALNPQLVKNEGENQRDKMLSLALTGTKFAYFLIAFFAIPYLIEAPFVLKVWLKSPPEYTIIFSRLILIGSMLSQLSFTIGTTVFAVGNIKRIALISSLLYVVGLPISYVLFKYGYQPFYIYITQIGIEVLLIFFRVYMSYKIANLNISEYLNKVIRPISLVTIPSLIVPGIFSLFFPEGIFRLFMVIIISSVTFSLCLYFTGLSQSEKKNIKSLASNFWAKLIYINQNNKK